LGRIVYVARRPDRCRWLAASEERTFGLILFDAVTFREGHQITWVPGWLSGSPLRGSMDVGFLRNTRLPFPSTTVLAHITRTGRYADLWRELWRNPAPIHRSSCAFNWPRPVCPARRSLVC